MSGYEPVPEGFRRNAWLITIALWLLQYAILTLRAVLIESNTPEMALKRAIWCAIGFVISAVVLLILQRLWNLRFLYQVLITLALALPLGLAFSFVNLIIYFNTLGKWEWIPTHIEMGSYWLWFFSAWASIILALNYSLRAAQEQRARVDAQVLAHQAQMRALRYQLNPHFLFNTLNSIAALSLDGHAKEAENMLVKLSGFLRAGLARDPLEEVPLEEEIGLQQLYFDIERLRYADRLVVRTEVPDRLLNALVPSFILQPLAENAIKHGVSPSAAATTVMVTACERDHMLVLRVEDDSAAQSDGAGTGVGLANVEARLRAQYGANFSFKAGRMTSRGYVAEMAVPLRFA